jgi:hypothetical protein
MGEKQGWQAIVNKKRQIQRDLLSLHADHEIRAPHNEYANSATDVINFGELASQLSQGKLSCENVMRAYITRLVRGSTANLLS